MSIEDRIENTYLRLELWSVWSPSSHGLKFPSTSVMCLAMMLPGDSMTTGKTFTAKQEELCMEIDRLVPKLPRDHMFTIKRHYINHKEQYQEDLDAAVRCLADKLDKLRGICNDNNEGRVRAVFLVHPDPKHEPEAA